MARFKLALVLLLVVFLVVCSRVRISPLSEVKSVHCQRLPDPVEVGLTAKRHADGIPRNPSTRTETSHGTVRVCSQDERLAHVRRTCAKWPTARKRTLGEPTGRLLVDEKHGLVACWMSKSGCTALKALLLTAAGYSVAESRLGHSLMKVHSGRLLFEHGLRRLDNFTETEVGQVLAEYFVFVVVRHPFERLLSTYRGKVLDPGTDFPSFASSARRLAHPESLGRNSTPIRKADVRKSLDLPTFGQFLEWIRSGDVGNRHWSRIVDDCHPCAQNWSAVLRLETMQHDGTLLTSRLGLDPEAVFPVRHSHQPTQVHDHLSLVMREFDDVGDGVIDYFIGRYEIDMEMFGYHWNKETKTASCAIPIENGTCC